MAVGLTVSEIDASQRSEGYVVTKWQRQWQWQRRIH